MNGVIQLKSARLQHCPEERFQLLTAALPIGVLYSDAFGDCLFVNLRWQEITGFSVGECLGEGWTRAIHPDVRGEVLAAWAEGRKDDYVAEIRLLTQSGEARWGRLRTAPMRDQRGVVIGFSGTIEDITRRRETEAVLARERDEAIEAAKSRAAFLASMSHEIRSPMHDIIGMADLLVDASLEPKHRDYAQTIHDSSESLITRIDDILDNSKIEAGELAFEHVDFNVCEVVESVVELFGVRAQGKGIELGSFIEPGIPARLRGDPGRLRQVLSNLLSNAIQFTESGEVFVTVRPESAIEADFAIHFEVRDTGLGMTPGQQHRLFSAYVQAEDSTGRRFGGTGPGLAISKQLVTMMGGDIGVETKPDEGSRFWFTVRLSKAAGDAEAERNTLGKRSTRILVADDSLVNRKVALAQLRKLRYAADVAADGVEVLAAMERISYDVILMDVEMPEMDGFEATRRIRIAEQEGRLPRARPARIIAMTANAMQGDRERYLAAGMDDYLGKPVRSDLLEAALSRAALFDSSSASMESSSRASNAGAAMPADAVSGESAVDMERLNDLACGKPDEIRELSRIFIEQGQGLLTVLRGAVMAGDAAEVSRLAHKLGGSSATCGMTALVGPMRQLEEMGKRGELIEASSVLNDGFRGFENVRGCLVSHGLARPSGGTCVTPIQTPESARA